MSKTIKRVTLTWWIMKLLSLLHAKFSDASVPTTQKHYHRDATDQKRLLLWTFGLKFKYLLLIFGTWCFSSFVYPDSVSFSKADRTSFCDTNVAPGAFFTLQWHNKTRKQFKFSLYIKFARKCILTRSSEHFYWIMCTNNNIASTNYLPTWYTHLQVPYTHTQPTDNSN